LLDSNNGDFDEEGLQLLFLFFIYLLVTG
jgi:hypothetical protein